MTIRGYFATHALIMLEATVLLTLLYGFFQPSPPHRDYWVIGLWLAIPIFRVRTLLHQRLWVESPLQNLFLAFLILAVVNFQIAPYARENFVVLICRPLLGFWIYLHALEHARVLKNLKLLFLAYSVMGLSISLLALFTTQWEPVKGYWINSITSALPTLKTADMPAFLQPLMLNFNSNEVGGVLTWFLPVFVGLAFVKAEQARWGLLRGLAIIAAISTAFALFLTQSRFAIAGALIACFIIAFMQLAPPYRRTLSIAFVGIALFGAVILFNPFGIIPRPSSEADVTGLTQRDTNSLSIRVDIWSSALGMLQDSPLTGVGISMFKTAAWVDERYQVPTYGDGNNPPPHAHNELLQIGADLGLGGLLLFLGFYYMLLQMLWRVWQHGAEWQRGIALSLFAGLLAHAIYGLFDAITLWDRFAFVFWCLAGLIGALHVFVSDENTSTTI